MPFAKFCSSGILDSMRSEDSNDSVDPFIRQAIGMEPIFPFPRTGDSSVHLMQLLRAFDRPDLSGFPLLTPLKIQMQKCEKCLREFCSPINYRRHIRVHRRSLNVNKEFPTNKELLASFWNKLSLEEANEVVSFNDVTIKEVPGSSVIRTLASSLQKPGFLALPQVYVKAGYMLLEIIQAKPSRLPISSQELFSILDDASEGTFLCAGTAASLQKYVFDGETARNSLELKNLVASTSFLFEQQLVKAWVAHKDAEALRCQKLLVEEEEAAQKRQAALLERKKQKKLRQKEQKVKEQYRGSNGDLNSTIDALDRPGSAKEFGPSSPSGSNSDSPDVPTNIDSCPESLQTQNKGSNDDIETQIGVSREHINQRKSQSIELKMVGGNGHRHLAADHRPTRRLQRGGQRARQNNQILKHEPSLKFGQSKDRSLVNGCKVWTKKLKGHDNGDSLKVSSASLGKTSHQMAENNCEVIIGSIPITLKTGASLQLDSRPGEAQVMCSTEHVLKWNNNSEKQMKADSNRVSSELWRAVNSAGTNNAMPDDGYNEDSEAIDMVEKDPDLFLSFERSMLSAPAEDDDYHNPKHYHATLDENSQQGKLPFSIVAAKEFLAQRWKEAISAEHVTLVLS